MPRNVDVGRRQGGLRLRMGRINHEHRNVGSFWQVDLDVRRRAWSAVVLPKFRPKPACFHADRGIDLWIVIGPALIHFRSNHEFFDLVTLAVERGFHDEGQELPQPWRTRKLFAGQDLREMFSNRYVMRRFQTSHYGHNAQKHPRIGSRDQAHIWTAPGGSRGSAG